MKTILILLSFVFLIGCAVQEPVITKVEPKIPVPEIVEPEIPKPVVEPEPELVEPEPVSEPVESEQVNLIVPVGGKVLCPIPERYTYVNGYCVEDACQNRAVTCMVQGNRIMRPECECWVYLGKATCSIKAFEETRVRSPLCTRRGQAGRICGAYDSNKKRCVNF